MFLTMDTKMNLAGAFLAGYALLKLSARFNSDKSNVSKAVCSDGHDKK